MSALKWELEFYTAEGLVVCDNMSLPLLQECDQKDTIWQQSVLYI
jgi:hypothetical protein